VAVMSPLGLPSAGMPGSRRMLSVLNGSGLAVWALA
jgi:hypothetical protein